MLIKKKKKEFFTEKLKTKVNVLTAEEIVLGVTVCDMRKNRSNNKGNVEIMLDVDSKKFLQFFKNQISLYSNWIKKKIK